MPSRRTTRPSAWSTAATAASRDLHAGDQQVHANRDADRATGATSLLVSTIRHRDTDTRPASPGHVLALAESIQALGLLEPLVIDRHNRLLAGLHRLEACRLLLAEGGAERQQHWERLLNATDRKPTGDPAEVATRLDDLQPGALADTGGRVPVRRIDIDAEADTDQALAIEVAENEQRQDYSPAEIRALAQRLQAAGYSASRGRPKKGSKPMMPAIEAVVGLKRVAIWRALRDGEIVSRETISPSPGERAARQIDQAMTRWRKTFPADSSDARKATKLAEQLSTLLRAADGPVEA